MKLLLDLFFTFARIGGLTFGGGYSMLPILQREVVEKRNWVTNEEIIDYYAIGQCTPGIIAINTATFIGEKCAGNIGGIVAALGVVFPSLIIITLIAAFLQNFSELAIVQNAFSGIRICVSVLIVNAVMKLWKGSIIDITTTIIFFIIFLLTLFTDLSPMIFIILSAITGIILKWRQKK